MMGSLFCGEVKYPVQYQKPNKQLRKDSVLTLEIYTEQGPVQEKDPEEPLLSDPATKWINIIMKW